MAYKPDPAWLLPMPGETFDNDRLFVLNMGLAWQIDHEPTPIFEDMQLFFWEKELAKHSLAWLSIVAKLVNPDSPKRKNKARYILDLADHFSNMLDRAVYNGS